MENLQSIIIETGMKISKVNWNLLGYIYIGHDTNSIILDNYES